MGVSSLKKILDQLVESGLITQEQFLKLCERKTLEDTLPSVAGVSSKLVSEGILTQYQASLVADGAPERLVIGEYVLIDLLGKGGMGEVYVARHQMMQREVAIKLLIPGSSEAIESIERFKREVRAAARLSHPNVVTALDAGMRDGQYFMVMEYVKGRNLASVVKSQGAIRLDRALDYTIQAGQGLEYAHRQGIIHRDVKPSNLLLGEDGTVKVSDLGLSRMLQSSEQVTAVNDDGDGLTSSGMIMGTVDFMAPEQAVTPRDADERADVYGLGCSLYYLATGGTVFHGDTPMSRLIAHREDAIPEITEVLPNAPKQLNHVLKRMLAKEPDGRYASMGEALRDLRNCLRLVQEQQSDLPETEYRVSPEPQAPRRTGAVLIAGLAIALIAVAAFTGLLNPEPPDHTGVLSGTSGVGTNSGETPPPELVIHDLTAESEPVDVLNLIDLQKVRLIGSDWHFEGDELNELVTGKADQTRLGLPVTVPDNYWISFEARRLPDSQLIKGPLVVGLAVGSSSGFAAFDAHRQTGARISFLGSRRTGATTLETSPFCRIPDEDFVTVRIEVSVQAADHATIRATINDIAPLEWVGNPAEIEVGDGWATGWPEPLFLGTNLETRYVIRNLRIGPGALPPYEPPAPAETEATDPAKPAPTDAETATGSEAASEESGADGVQNIAVPQTPES